MEPVIFTCIVMMKLLWNKHVKQDVDATMECAIMLNNDNVMRYWD